MKTLMMTLMIDEVMLDGDIPQERCYATTMMSCVSSSIDCLIAWYCVTRLQCMDNLG